MPRAMNTMNTGLGIALLAILCVPTRAGAEGAPEAKDADAFAVKLSGAVSVWGLTQRGFFLGKDVPLDKADYVVQNVRLNLTMGTPKVGGVVRADVGQGWWGVDNSPNVVPTVAADGTVGAGYNADAMFGAKDTNYPVHVDHAYLFFELPWAPGDVQLRLQVGRQPLAAGNQLVLDGEQDALLVTAKVSDHLAVDAFWAKVAEGQNAIKGPRGLLMNDEDEWADADLFGGKVRYAQGDYQAELFGLFYKDHIDDYDHLPQGLGYAYSRFQPQVSQAVAVGATASGKASVAQGLTWMAEVDYLFGKDDVDNADHAGGLLDRNDGTLMGFNALVKATQALDVGVPFDLTVLAGLGSGDDDPAGGKGNLNRIQTAGYWPLTNVWEDSVMPDVGGISPQGLGSPASRGYRELENTTAAQLGLGVVPWKPLRLEASYTFLRATQDVHGFDATGTPTADTSKDLGQEIDVNLKLTILPGLKYLVLFGYFLPGDASALLINGDTQNTDAAWEVKQVLMYAF